MLHRSADILALLSPDEMARADRLTIAGGVPGERLMELAGAAVASEVMRRWSPRPVAVLCGPGNNGGDGFVVARHLAANGWKVELLLLGDKGALKGDAAYHAGLWSGAVGALSGGLPDDVALVIDAIFGAGLAREVTGPARQTLEAAVGQGVPIVAIDVPSGVDGASGAVRGYAPPCVLTVTFFRKKPGHLLYPGRALCGETVVAEIGIPTAVLGEIRPSVFENDPALWLADFPWPRATDHKYRRGHVLIAGGAVMTGAARLAARAAARSGAGLVTIAAPEAAFAIYAAALASILVQPIRDLAGYRALLDDIRRNALLVGPGAGTGSMTREMALAALATHRAVVLDADVFAVFAADGAALAAAIAGPTVMTPHEGEFARVFGPITDRLADARAAARASGAVIVLKGADTVIAAPSGWTAINANAPPTLATAGSGDVLAGLVIGLLAQGMAAHLAAAAASWLHGRAAARFGPGLVADDLIDQLPAVLRELKEPSSLP